MKNWARPGFELALQRLDILIHREILRLRANYQLSLDEFRGLYISDQQVDELILQRKNFGQVDTTRLTQSASEILAESRGLLAQDSQWKALTRSYGLTDFEQDVLLLAFLPELHSKYPVLFAYLNNDITRKFPTIELALNLFCERPADDSRQPLASGATLFGQGLILPLAGQNDHYALQSGFIIAPAVREFLFGHPAMDRRIAQACRLSPRDSRDTIELPFDLDLRQQFLNFGKIIRNPGKPPFFVIESVAGSGAEELAEVALSAAGRGCCRVELKQLLRERDGFADSVQSLVQTARLEQAGLVIVDFAEALEGDRANHPLLSLLLCRMGEAGLPGFILVHPRSRWWELLAKEHHLLYEMEPAGVAERQQYWHHQLKRADIDTENADVAAVADYFNLAYGQICAAVDDLSFRGRGDISEAGVSQTQLFDAARRQSHGDMGELADRVCKDFQLADLVLPNAILARIREVISAIRSRRLVFEEWDLQRRMGGASGIVALFAGASGTGKTMTASVIANEIGLDLYRIELSGIVSKYIGETEKNLDRIFAAAHKANCILFFDEADALFGKRSEVKDAHDRYANIEVAYLLQKIENHDGIVILTTNLAKSIDQAFSRRMQFIVEFPRPDVTHREKLWCGMFGEAVPLSDDVDFNFLARQLENTGGDIKNMVLDAALMAAASDEKIIDMALLVRAAARQMMKQGKVPSAVEFKQYFSLVDSSSA